MPAKKTDNTKQTKTSTRSKKDSGEKKLSKELLEAQRVRKTRMWSTILFVIGILVVCLTYIKGQTVWTFCHNILWGLFGISTVMVAPIVIYVAIMMALDKSKSAVIVKLLQGLFLMLLVSPAFEIIGCLINGAEAYALDFTESMTLLYKNGVDMKGGGAFSVFLGWTLTKLFGAVCALIVIILFVLLMIMLLTNITFVDVAKFIARRFKSVRESMKEMEEEKTQEFIERERTKLAKETEKVSDKKPSKERKKSTDGFDASKYINEDFGKKKEKEKEPEKKPESIADSEPYVFFGDERKETKVKDKKAVKAKAPVEIEEDNTISESDTVNPIYVDDDGQTTLIETEDNTKSTYQKPSVELLNMPTRTLSEEECRAEIQHNSETLVECLKSFGVSTRITEIHRGPSVTRYEIQPAAGVKVSRITGLVDDIALNLAANGVRIEAPIPGKAAVGIELANKNRDIVNIRELIDSEEFRSMKSNISFPVGKDIEGKIITVDIARMPHLLIAGTTGSGKSVLTNSIIMSILFNASPDEVKLILIDPKQVEFPVYNGIPHLLIPVVTEAKKAAGALGWAVTEMMKRYNMFANAGVRDIKEYNEYVKTRDDGTLFLPKIVIVVDELADLMMAAPKEVEDSICRIAQLARAAGMHLVIATQSPRVDVVTGLIKANIDSQIALRVANQIDSRVILNEIGAEKLLGHGDLLIKCVAAGFDKPGRIQGGYVATDEIRRVVDFLKAQQSSQYDEEISNEIEKFIPVSKAEKAAQEEAENDSSNGEESLINRAIDVIVSNQKASTSFLQRKLKLGYAKAARIMDEIEEMGIIGPGEGANAREIRISREQWLERKASLGGASMPVLEKPDENDE